MNNPTANDTITPNYDEIEEARKHWEGIQNDEAASHNVPDFFSLHLGDRIRGFFNRLTRKAGQD